MGGRVEAVQQWLARRADSAIGRLALQWFRAYFEASRNSGSATTLYAFLSVGPLLLAVTGLLHAAGSDTNAFAERLIDHNHLTGATASLVRDTFGTASQNALAASVSAVVGFLIWGIGIGQIYQDVYARAWGIQVRTLADQVRFAVWFFVLSGALGLFVLAGGTFRNAGWAALIAAWLVGSLAFWLWTPRYLLRGQIGLRRLLPGAILATILIGGAIATSPFFLGPWLNSEGGDFGSFGVVLGLVAWGFVLATMSLACAVFSPVWIAWREAGAAPNVSPGEEP
jgi:membrane protein